MAHARVLAKEIRMQRSFLPFLFLPSPAASRLLGRKSSDIALLALRAILAHNRSLEVAHQQIRFAGHDFAFSSRITASGDLVVDLDVGDPSLEGASCWRTSCGRQRAPCAASPRSSAP
jgi:hypothetical protein